MKLWGFAFFILILASIASVNAVSETYYFTGSGGSGSGFTSDNLATSYDTTQAVWSTTANGQTGTYTIQLGTETTVNANTITLNIYCDKDSSAGGDQTKFDYVVYDCGTSSTCGTTEGTIFTGTSLDCDNGVGTPALETDTGTATSQVIEANEYLGIVLTSNTNKAPSPRLYYDTATYPSEITMDITESASNAAPSVTTGLADSPDPQNVSQDITFTITGDDPDGDNYYLTVCTTDGISAGAPGTCTGGTLCTSTSTTDATQASCTNTTNAAMTGTFTAYGFICDTNSNCNTTSSDTSYTVKSNPPYFSAALSATANVLPGETITYTATGTDPNGDPYRMTVCKTNGINQGYPGTCTGATLCTSGAFSSGNQANCTNTTSAADKDSTITAYAFICDSYGVCNTTSSSDSTSVGNNKADWTGNLAVNDSTPDTGDTILFTGQATDYEGEDYYLTVCDSNSINDAAPGTCNGNTICTSAQTASGVTAACTNITNSNQEPSFTAYGFICDVGSGTCNTSTSQAITVTNSKADWTVNLAATASVTYGDTITYTGTGTDKQGDNYRMTVCRTNSINDGYPGTCAASQTLCTSGVFGSGAQASCTYDSVFTDSGTLTAYAFLCDAGTNTCNTSTTDSTFVDNNKSGLVSTTPGAVPFYTNGSQPMTSSNFSCLGSMTNGSSCLVTWWVNATGEIGTIHEFYAYANSTINSTLAESNRINITIVAAVGGDPCTYGGTGDWTISLSDNCVYTSVTDIGANSIFITGTSGSVTIGSGGGLGAQEIHYTPSDFNGDATFAILTGGQLSIK